MGLWQKLFGKEVDMRKEDRLIKVRFPSMVGDEDKTITVRQLKQEYKDYLIFDPKVGEQVDLEKLANLDEINEVVVMPPISGGRL